LRKKNARKINHFSLKVLRNFARFSRFIEVRTKNMKVFRALAILLVAAMPLLGHQAPAGEALPVGIVIDRVELKDVSTDRVRFEIASHVTADRHLKIKRVSFGRMYLGSVPIYLSPIDERLELEKDVATVLPQVPVTIYFRDLDSLEPIEHIVREEKATVTGKARIDLDLNLIEKVLSRQKNVYADIPISISTPVQVPGGMLGKTAALTTLRAAQFALSIGSSALHALRQSQKSWEEKLRTQYVPALVIVESRYAIRLKTGEQTDFVVRGLGFRITDDKFVVTDEIYEPWKYDNEVAKALQTKAATLIDEDRDLLVWNSSEPLDPNMARSLLRKTIHEEHHSDQTENAHVPSEEKSVKIRLSKRDSNANYAVFRFTRAEDKGTPVQLASDDVLHNQNWDRLTMFRVDDDGQLELITTPAHRANDRIILEDAVDERAFGSLLIAPEGAVGVVQAEQSGMVLKTKW
jgi:hypothetical protein